MSDISTVTVEPLGPVDRMPGRRGSFSARPPGSRRDSVSPCSSRSTIAWCSSRSRRSALSLPALAPLASLRNSCSTASFTASGVVWRLAAMALIGRPSATCSSSSSSCSERSPSARTGAHQRVDDLGVEHRAAGGHRADGLDQLVALGHPVLQQVGVAGGALGQQRDGVLGVVVLGQDHDAGAGVALAHLLGRLDALVLEGGRHADVGDDDLGLGLGGAGDQLVVVGGDADDLEVGLRSRAGPGRPRARGGCRRRGTR